MTEQWHAPRAPDRHPQPSDFEAERRVRAVLATRLPTYEVTSVALLGEGMENVAYLVNGELIVRFSKDDDPTERVEREAAVLAAVAAVTPVAIPTVTFTDPASGCLAYRKLSGIAVRDLPLDIRAARAASVGAALGAFLEAVQRLPVARLADFVGIDDDPLEQWLSEATEIYRDLKARLPATAAWARPAIEAFLDAAPPPAAYDRVFSHNDLGSEHVLLDSATWQLSGIIDWSDAAIDDPAYDFGLIYRDLGPRALDAALSSSRDDREQVRQRAVFYARCSVVEDLAHGLERPETDFFEQGLASLHWLFP